METGPQTTQLIMYLNPSCRFLNLTYCNDIIKNVIGRERSEFFYWNVNKRYVGEYTSDSGKEIKMRIHVNYISDE